MTNQNHPGPSHYERSLGCQFVGGEAPRKFYSLSETLSAVWQRPKDKLSSLRMEIAKDAELYDILSCSPHLLEST